MLLVCLGSYFLALSWLFFSPVVLFNCPLDEFFWIALFVVMQLKCDVFLQFCPFRLKQHCLLGRVSL